MTSRLGAVTTAAIAQHQLPDQPIDEKYFYAIEPVAKFPRQSAERER